MSIIIGITVGMEVGITLRIFCKRLRARTESSSVFWSASCLAELPLSSTVFLEVKVCFALLLSECVF